jgi:hypothetical protein
MFVVLGAGLLVGMTAAKTQTTYTDLFNPLGLPNPLDVPPIGQFLDPGKVICPGQTLTDNPMQPCPEGSRIAGRDIRALTRVDSEDPAMAGWMTVELNANLAPDYAGPVWGKLSIQLDAGGAWEGTWNGIRERVPGQPIWTVDLSMVLHGTGGKIDGLQATCTEMITALAPMPILYKGVGTCRVLSPTTSKGDKSLSERRNP